MPATTSPASGLPPRTTGREPLRGMPGWLFLMGVLTAIGPLSIDMYLPSLPAIGVALHSDIGAVQRTLSMFFIGLALGQLIYGPLSDRFGRKPPLYFGLALYAIASLLCALAPNVVALQWGRFLQALGACSGMVVSRAVIRDRCDPVGSARAMSLVMLVMGIAPILAPQLGVAVLEWFSWRAIFALLVGFGIICCVAIHFGMEESLDPQHVRPLHFGQVLRTYGELLRDRHFLTFSLSGGLASSGMFAYIAGSPFVFIELYHIPANLYGWVFGANAFGLIFAAQVNARLLARFTPQQVLGASIGAVALSGALLLILTLLNIRGLAVLLPLLFVFVGCIGFTSPNAAALALQHQGSRAGAASALMGMLQLSMATLSSSAISFWAATSELPMALVMALCGGAALLMFRAAMRTAIRD